MESVEFWMMISELNELTTILAIDRPEYSERISILKKKLTKYIREGLEESKKLSNIETDSWYLRNN